MWLEDDFEDNSRQIKVVPKGKAAERIDNPDVEPDGQAERYDEQPGS